MTAKRKKVLSPRFSVPQMPAKRSICPTLITVNFKQSKNRVASLAVCCQKAGLITILLILTFTLSVFAQKQGAVETVKSFYVFHNSRSGIFSLHEVRLLRKWFTVELYNLFLNELKREDEYIRKNPTDKPHYGDGFPLQPFSECVEGETVIINTFEAKEISADASKATVEVKFYSPEKCKKELIDTYKVELVKTKKIWLINDWIYSDNKRLADDLKRKDY